MQTLFSAMYWHLEGFLFYVSLSLGEAAPHIIVRYYSDQYHCLILPRRRYRTFQWKCWQHVTRKCREDELCISTLSEQDLSCSESDDCKAAYIGTLGTILQAQCTCRTITQSEESVCKIFQHMLHRRSCFSKFCIFSKLYMYFVFCLCSTRY